MVVFSRDMEENAERLLDDPTILTEVLHSMSQVSFLNRLDSRQLEVLARGGDLKYFKPNETIFRQGDHDDGLHVVLDGQVLLISRGAENRSHLKATMEKGSSFGEIAFMTGQARNLTALAGPDGAVDLVLSRRQFDGITQENPGIGHKVFRQLLDVINVRMQHLPPFLRNYLLWGYRSSGTDSVEIDRTAAIDLSTFRFWIAGGAGALLGYILCQEVIPQLCDGRVGLSLVLLAVGGAIGGALVADVFRYVEEQARSRMRHPRSCGNCNFSFWDERSGKIGCLYTREGLKDMQVRPGREFDTYTACPSFEQSTMNTSAKAMARSEGRW